MAVKKLLIRVISCFKILIVIVWFVISGKHSIRKINKQSMYLCIYQTLTHKLLHLFALINPEYYIFVISRKWSLRLLKIF